MNKKAAATYSILYWMWVILFLAAVLTTMWYMIGLYQKYTVDTSLLESELFFNNLIYSPHSIAYFDPETGRAIPGTVDANNFKPERVQNAYNFGQSNFMISAYVVLRDAGDKTAAAMPVYFNQDLYNQLNPLKGISGVGGTQEYNKSTYVVYFDGTNFKPGILTANILIPRS